MLPSSVTFACRAGSSFFQSQENVRVRLPAGPIQHIATTTARPFPTPKTCPRLRRKHSKCCFTLYYRERCVSGSLVLTEMGLTLCHGASVVNILGKSVRRVYRRSIYFNTYNIMIDRDFNGDIDLSETKQSGARARSGFVGIRGSTKF